MFSWMNSLYWKLFIQVHGGSVGKNFRIAPGASISLENSTKIIIGDNVSIGAMSGIFLKGMNNNTANIIIGDNVIISKCCTIAAHSTIKIGNSVRLRPYSTLIDADHLFQDLTKTLLEQSELNIAEIRVQDNVEIGERAVILKGVEIEHNAVITANTVVTKNIAAGKIMTGVPAQELVTGTF